MRSGPSAVRRACSEMAAAERGLERAVRRQLTCPVCLELFRQPVALGCGHTFCRACILQVWESRERRRRPPPPGDGGEGGGPPPGDSFSCPECRQTFANKNVTKNFLAANLVEKLDEAKSASASQNGSAKRQCEKHQKPFTLYCATHHRILCDACRLSKAHRNCDVLSVQDTSSEFLARKKELEAKIRGDFAKLIGFLEEERETFLRQLDKVEQAAIEEMEAKSLDLGATILELEQSIADIKSKLTHSVPLEELLDSISRPIPDLGKVTVPKLPPCWELFSGPFQLIAWKRMLDIVNPGLENLYFNPKTAHPSLRFSLDYTGVEACAEQGTLPGPGRFDCLQAVLADAEFSSGRRYWEVDVCSAAAWHLGVACAHRPPRQGYVKLAPAHGYWTIGRLLGYWANEQRRRQPLAVEGELHRVGVYLDFEGGQVSFYDAPSMALLCTFWVAFHSPVRPFFSLSKDVGGALRLCHF